MMGNGKCKGKDKGKGKGKGQGKCKRSAWDADLEAQDSEGKCLKKCAQGFRSTASDGQELDRCKTPGCNYKRTWHPTHCCAACAKHGLDKHGPKCDRQCLDLVTASSPIGVDEVPSAP